VSRRTATVAIGAGLSTATDAHSAAYEAAAAARAAAPDPDLAFLFLSAEHLDRAEEAADAVRDVLEPRSLLGCVAGGVLARDRELETGPGAAVWAARLPGAEIECFHATAEATDGTEIEGFPELEDPSVVVLLVDPFTFPVAPVLESLNERAPGPPVVGGMATGGGGPGAQALLADGEIHDEGAVGAVVSGVPVVTLVSQGCAPIGPESVITRAEENVVLELAGKPAFERLREIVASLSPAERRLAAEGLLAGLVIDENRADYGPGDYLMRGLVGADEASGALAVGAPVRVGQTLRFHVRDAESADEDLRRTLAGGVEGVEAAGALLFTCNGRGRNMFPTADHDARAAGQALKSDALAGFFCGGEIGPVGGRSFLHGFTATLAVFLEP
jgi:small ligand-binding sensory domain FIST